MLGFGVQGLGFVGCVFVNDFVNIRDAMPPGDSEPVDESRRCCSCRRQRPLRHEASSGVFGLEVLRVKVY